jgi:hypothetical protein
VISVSGPLAGFHQSEVLLTFATVSRMVAGKATDPSASKGSLRALKTVFARPGAAVATRATGSNAVPVPRKTAFAFEASTPPTLLVSVEISAS